MFREPDDWDDARQSYRKQIANIKVPGGDVANIAIKVINPLHKDWWYHGTLYLYFDGETKPFVIPNYSTKVKAK